MLFLCPLFPTLMSSLFFCLSTSRYIIAQGCWVSVLIVSEAVRMSIISCLKCVVSQSNVCLIFVVVALCQRGLVDEA